MITRDEIQSKEWALNAYQVTLVRYDGKVALEGTGCISKNKKNKLEGNFIVSGCVIKNIYDAGSRVGKLIEHDQLYFFQCNTSRGYCYSDDNVFRIVDRISESNFSVVIVFHKIVFPRLLPCILIEKHISLTLWKKVNIPLVAKNVKRRNRKVATDKFTRKHVLHIGNSVRSFTVKNAYKGTKEIEYKSRAPKEEGAFQIQEALYFLTGQIPNLCICRVSELNHEITTIYSASIIDSIRTYPFINTNGIEKDKEYTAFLRYFDRIICERSPHWSEYARIQYTVDQMAMRSTRAASLVLCVSIEKILNESFGELGIKVPSQKVVGIIVETINKCKCGTKVRNRCAGIIRSSLGKIRAIDKLRRLEKWRKIPSGIASKWDRIRNSSAHGGIVESAYTQEALDDLYLMYDLYHSLIAIIIKYEGDFTRYSMAGWPRHSQKEKLSS